MQTCADLVKSVSAAAAGEREQDNRLCIVHNAASQPVDSMADPARRIEDIQRELNIQITSPSLITSRLSPLLQAWTAGSSVIYIGSTLSEKAVPNKALYCTAKHAMVGMMRSTVQDFFGMKVHTALVCPGFTETPLLVDALKVYDMIFRLSFTPASFSSCLVLLRLSSECFFLDVVFRHVNDSIFLCLFLCPCFFFF